ncbi:MAG TPA: hypothetical protein VLH15_06050 [Dehalococcoidales bacterium]|nr:hypothetical protein [Dehalococcoidales bacterium]
MKTLNQEIREYLLEEGASLVGFANLTELPENTRNNFPRGISIAVALSPASVQEIGQGLAQEYWKACSQVNAKLDELGLGAERFLKDRGFAAQARTTRVVKIDQTARTTDLPHKTVATRAGLGWIGKCALCITPGFGAAQRFTCVLTDAPLECGHPINQSGCGDCVVCQEICPSGAVSGHNWFAGLERDRFFDAAKCFNYIAEFRKTTGCADTTCGRCVKACPWTQKYLNN